MKRAKRGGGGCDTRLVLGYNCAFLTADDQL